MAADPIRALRAPLEATLHGLNAKGIALILLLIAGNAVFSWRVTDEVAAETAWWPIAAMVGRSVIAKAIALLPGLFAGVAAWNRIRAPAWIRVALTVGVVAAVTWAAQRAGWSVELPISDRIAEEYPATSRGFAMLFVMVWISNVGVALVLVATFLLVARADAHARALEREALRALEAGRGLAEARMQATQAQIEPHFLFNTLANVRRLYRLDAQAARATLRQFSAMLASALPAMRSDRSTLGKELSLSLAYLAVQQIRMGERLTVETDVPDGLRGAELPPMMLPTLVENAIKHGLAPLARGGVVRIAAEAAGRALRVKVADSGRGLAESSGTGVGLANIDTRLAALYGNAAFVDLQRNDLGGVTATIELPLRFATAAEAPREHAGA